MSDRYIDPKLSQALAPHQTIDPERFMAQMSVFDRMRAIILEAQRAKLVPAEVKVDEIALMVDGVPVLKFKV